MKSCENPGATRSPRRDICVLLKHSLKKKPPTFKNFIPQTLTDIDYYTMHMFNAVSHIGNFSDAAVHQTSNNIGRKRTRSNSVNKCEQTQKTPRLLSPQHQRNFPPPLSVCNERRYSRSNSIGDLSCRTQLLAVQDSRYSEPMDCDILPCEFENLDYDMNQSVELNVTSPSTRSQRSHHRQIHIPSVAYTMGRRTDCERCRLRVPGHFAHITNH